MFNLAKPEPVTRELIPAHGDNPAVRVTFNPQPSPLSLRAARRAVVEVLRDDPKDMERAGDAFSSMLIRHNIRSWEGLGDDGGVPVEPTPDRELLDEDGNVTGIELGTISAFLAEPRLFEAADREYVMPWTELDSEKNGLAPSPNGTSEGETPDDDTASLSATPEGSADAGTTKPAPRRARTSATSRKPRKAKPSGS